MMRKQNESKFLYERRNDWSIDGSQVVCAPNVFINGAKLRKITGTPGAVIDGHLSSRVETLKWRGVDLSTAYKSSRKTPRRRQVVKRFEDWARGRERHLLRERQSSMAKLGPAEWSEFETVGQWWIKISRALSRREASGFAPLHPLVMIVRIPTTKRNIAGDPRDRQGPNRKRKTEGTRVAWLLDTS